MCEVDDDIRDAPPPVIGAVALGVAPLPFLAVYAVLFISRGTVHPVVPPDIGNSKHDELIAGLIALAAFVIGALAAYWFLDRRRRWLFAIFQALTLATCIDFLIDSTTGPRAIPFVLAVTSLVAIVLAFLPASWEHMHRDAPPWLRRPGAGRSLGPADSALPAESPDIPA
jgi:peptidoglycan/LPS O-acetylase OafA/YrhL